MNMLTRCFARGRQLFLLLTALLCFNWSSTLWSAEVHEITAENWRQVAPTGKEADWIYGDYVLRNDLITAVIARPKAGRNANMTVRNVAGALIDLTFRYRPNDQLSCFFPGAAELPLRRLTYRAEGDESVVVCRSEETDAHPTLEVEYRLRDGDRYVTVISRYSNPHEAELEFSARDAVRADRGFAHRVRDNVYVCEDLWWRQAYGILPMEHRISTVADTLKRERPIFAYHSGDDPPERVLQPGESFELIRRFIVGENSIGVLAEQLRMNDTELVEVAVVVTDGSGRTVPGAHVRVQQGGKSLGRAVAPEAGPLLLRLPAGVTRFEVSEQARGATQHEVNVTGKRLVVPVSLPQPGYVDGRVLDQAGQKSPAKIQYRGNDVDDPDFGPDTKAFLVKNVQYTANGEFSAELAPGTYDVIISRGPEFDAVFETISVQRGETVSLDVRLNRTVATPGWISTDYHSHSSPSGDNTSDQLGRVLNLLAEHIEFAPCTEHNRISTYARHLEVLRATHLMATCTGMELTGNPLPINHQNAFPLYHHPHTQDGGGPTTHENPVVQIERLAMWDDGSEKLVQENHPNLEQIWADRDKDGQEDDGFREMFKFMDVVEVHPPADLFAEPGDKTGPYDNVVHSWLRMLNKGFRIPAVVNTDAHYNFHGSGWLRNYVKSDTDAPAEIRIDEMVRQSEQGHLVVTNGPYLEVTAMSGSQTAIAGDDLVADNGIVELHVRVQCPNWFDVNRVQVFINGRPSPEHNFTRRWSAAEFGREVVKFDRKIAVQLDEDAHLIVGTIGEGWRLGPVVGPDHEQDVPVAFANPIFVDVDGGGFKSNGDLLDLPFPYLAE